MPISMPLIESGTDAAVNASSTSASRRIAGGGELGDVTRYTPRRVNITFIVSERMRRSSQSERLWM